MKKKVALITLLCLFISSQMVIQNVKSTEVPEFFTIDFLSPNTRTDRNQWVLTIEQQLPEIGIGIDDHESSGWGDIAPRTYSYPLIDYDYIPTYDEGGYDVLFIGWSWGLDWDPSGLYDHVVNPLYGNNYYQYYNLEYDRILDDYLVTSDPVLRKQYSHQLQSILYEELPAISILYTNDLFGFKSGLENINPLLIHEGEQRIENWDDPEDHTIKHAVPINLYYPNTFVEDSYYDNLWMQNVYGSLFSRNTTTLLWEPNIASGYSITDGGTNITVSIDPNAKFSDGSPVLAEDVKYTYELHMSPEVESELYGFLTKWFESNDSIVEVSPDTISFLLYEPFNFPLSILSYGIIDKSEVEAKIISYEYDIFDQIPGTADVGWSLVKSCGPMMVHDYNATSNYVQLLPNPHWHGKTVELTEWNQIYIPGKDDAIAALKAGNIDIVDYSFFPLLADFEGEAGLEGVAVETPHHQEISINMRHPLMGTGELTPVGTEAAAKNIRKAISHAIPRDTIVSQILEGLGRPGIIPMPDSCIGFNSSLEPYSHNLTLAMEYMKLAGYDPDNWPIGPTPTSSSFSLYSVILMFVGLTMVQVVLNIFKKK